MPPSTHPRLSALTPSSPPSHSTSSWSSRSPLSPSSTSTLASTTSPSTYSNPALLSRPKSNPSIRAAPYMVALSGWPEPVYIESPVSEWEKRRSRPNTPRQSFSGEVHDGMEEIISRGGSPVLGYPGHPGHPGAIKASPRGGGTPGTPGTSPAEAGSVGSSVGSFGSLGTGSPSSLGSIGISRRIYQSSSSSPASASTSSPSSIPPHRPETSTSYRTSPRGTPPREGPGWGFQTSSTRSGAEPNPPSTGIYPGVSRNSSTNSRGSHFFDPRLAPNVAVLHNRGALRVAPAWSGPSTPIPTTTTPTSHHTSLPSPSAGSGGYSGYGHSPLGQGVLGQGVKVPAGQRGMGLLVMRAVPDVFPPPIHEADHENGSVAGSGSGFGHSPGSSSPPDQEGDAMVRKSSVGSGEFGGQSGLGGVDGMSGRLPGTTGSAMSGNGANGGAVAGGAGGVGMATEVYPRDPESGFLWGAGPAAGGGSSGIRMGMDGLSPTNGSFGMSMSSPGMGIVGRSPGRGVNSPTVGMDVDE